MARKCTSLIILKYYFFPLKHCQWLFLISFILTVVCSNGFKSRFGWEFWHSYFLNSVLWPLWRILLSLKRYFLLCWVDIEVRIFTYLFSHDEFYTLELCLVWAWVGLPDMFHLNNITLHKFNELLPAASLAWILFIAGNVDIILWSILIGILRHCIIYKVHFYDVLK